MRLFACTLLLAAAALAQDPLTLLPNNYRLLLENPTDRVIRVHYSPHEKLPVHNHSDKPTIYVYLSDSGPVRYTHVEEHPFTMVRQPLKAGTFRVSPGRLEKHDVENLGDIPTDYLRVELKNVPLGLQNDYFRSPRNFDESHTGVTSAYAIPRFGVDRIVALAGDSVNLPKSTHPALLIAFTPSAIGDGTLQSGEVAWLDADRAGVVRSVDGAPKAHLLRISFPAAKKSMR